MAKTYSRYTRYRLTIHTKIRCIHIYACDHGCACDNVPSVYCTALAHTIIILHYTAPFFCSIPHILHSAACVVHLALDIGVVYLRAVQVGFKFLGLLPLLAVQTRHTVRHRSQPDPDLYQPVLFL